MQKLFLQVPAAILRKLPPLCARTANVTRCISTYVMLNRYVELRVFALQIYLTESSHLLPTKVENETVDALLKTLHDLALVTKVLQGQLVTLLEALHLFDEVISGFCSSADRVGIGTVIGRKTVIIKNNSFESAIVKTQSNNERDLSVIETRSVGDLLLKRRVRAVRLCESNKTTLYAEMVLKQMRSSGDKKKRKFINFDLFWVHRTSVSAFYQRLDLHFRITAIGFCHLI